MIDESAETGSEEWAEPLFALLKPELKPGERLLWISQQDRSSPTRTGRASGCSGGAWSVAFGGVLLAGADLAFLSLKAEREVMLAGSTILSVTAMLLAAIFLLAMISHAFARADVRRVEDLIRRFLVEPDPAPRPDPSYTEY